MSKKEAVAKILVPDTVCLINKIVNKTTLADQATADLLAVVSQFIAEVESMNPNTDPCMRDLLKGLFPPNAGSSCSIDDSLDKCLKSVDIVLDVTTTTKLKNWLGRNTNPKSPKNLRTVVYFLIAKCFLNKVSQIN